MSNAPPSHISQETIFTQATNILTKVSPLSFLTSAPQETNIWIPSLESLVKNNVRGADISNEYLIAIITKAQPHHTRWTLAHLGREQLVEHVDALIEWWKKVNPRRASLISGDDIPREVKELRQRDREESIRSVERKDDCCCVIS